MLNGDGNENSKKSVGLKLAKKKQLYTCSTLLQLHVILPFFFFFFSNGQNAFSRILAKEYVIWEN